MSDPTCQHPLRSFFTRRKSIAPKISNGVHVLVQPNMSYVNFRGDAGTPKFCADLEEVFAQAIPQVANTWTQGRHSVYWLGPDEWLAVTPVDAGAAHLTAAPLIAQLQQRSIAVTAQQGGLLQLNIKGDNVRDLLAKGSTLDFHPNAFKLGHCAQTGLGKGGVLIAMHDSSPEYTVIVRRSFAQYTAMWLEHAGQEFGIDFAPDT